MNFGMDSFPARRNMLSLAHVMKGDAPNRAQLLRELVKEIEWNLSMNIKVGSQVNLVYLKEKLLRSLGI